MAAQKKGDPTMLVVLGICLLVAIVQGARGIHAERINSGFASASSQVLSVDDADASHGSLRVSTSMCADNPATLDVLRHVVTRADGTVVAQLSQAVVGGRARQSATLGSNLAPGRYKVTTTCLRDQEQDGEAHSTWATLGSSSGSASSSGPGNPGLPQTGR